MRTLKRLAKLEHLPQWLQLVTRYARELGLPAKRIREIELAVEEAIVNVCHYAYPQQVGELEVACTLDENNGLVIEIADWGMPFDPLALTAPDLTDDLADRQVGGMGVYLIRKLMDKVSYRRNGAQNILQLIVRLQQEG